MPDASADGPAALVRAAQAGDRAALGALYERYRGFVHGILLAHADPHEVPDLMQDVFVTVLEEVRSRRDPAAFGAWLATVARNRARAHARRARPTVARTDASPAPPA